METAGTTAEEKRLDIRETGALKNGEPQIADKRLYFQLQVFTDCENAQACIAVLREASFESVLYLDINDPKGIGVLIMTDNPSVIVDKVRSIYHSDAFQSLKRRPELTMIGRTYSTGREADLLDWLLVKPKKNALNPSWPWAVWYPLRRKPEFAALTDQEQGKILMEHGILGRSYGTADFAHDIRLACHGLDHKDNEFLIGLVGKELYPLSRIVQDMRKTQQTSKYIQSLGPFFVGKAIWQSSLKTI